MHTKDSVLQTMLDNAKVNEWINLAAVFSNKKTSFLNICFTALILNQLQYEQTE